MEDVIAVVIRSVTIYLFIIFAIRIFGKKELAQLSVIDLVFILLISNAVQNAMVGDNTTLLGGITAALTLFIVNYGIKELFFRSEKLSGLLQGNPVLLIYKGKVLQEHIKKVQITHSELEAAVREHGVEAITEVEMAVLEVDGNISIVSKKGRITTTKRRKAHKIVQRT